MTHRRRVSIVLALAWIPTEAWAIQVPSEVQTIQEALTLVDEWGTIYVDDAAYLTENPVTVTVNVHIASEDGDPVAYPQFLVLGATLRLSGGYVQGNQSLRGALSTGEVYEQTSGILALDGAVEGHDLTLIGAYGYGMYAVESDVSLTDSYVYNGNYVYAVKVSSEREDVSVSFTGVTFAYNQAGAVYVQAESPRTYTVVTVTGSTFSNNSGADYGSDMSLYNVDEAGIASSTFDSASATAAAGSILSSDSNLEIVDSSFDGNSAPVGGSIVMYGFNRTPTMDIRNTTFQGGSATADGGVGGEIYATEANLTLSDVSAAGSSALYGGFLAVELGSLDMQATNIWDAYAQVGAALYLYGTDASTTTSTFCGNFALQGSTVYATEGALTLLTSVVRQNETSGGAAVETLANPTSVYDVTFVGNTGIGGAVQAVEAPVEVVNTLFTGSTAALTVGGGAYDNVVGYNLYHDIDVVSDLTTYGDDVFEEPQFHDDFDASDCASEPWLSPSSPAAGAGDPLLANSETSPSDIGAYPVLGGGGDTGGETGIVDTGVIDTGWWWPDTGDTAWGETGVGAPDADGDGFPNSEDCAPGDPSIHPGADDDPTDDIDQDCDGDAATGIARGGCGCDNTGGAASGAAVVALGALLAARRRRGSPA
jgi:hypothetical protein